MTEMNLPESVKLVLEALYHNGFSAYVVGGCVRDAILGKEPKDYDVTTSALPEQVMEVFRGYEVIPTGLQHGTVTIMVHNQPIEVTTYRIDGEYSDGRRPDSVTFALSVEDDLMRRDFTMNAIAYNPWQGIVDPYNGIEDINNNMIRCMGKPQNRFNEDGLRILRAIRFSAQLGFDIEEDTSNAIHEMKNLLNNISKERIQSELVKILMSDRCGYLMFALYHDVFEMFLSDVRINFSKRLTMSNINSSNEDGNDIISRLALLFDGDDVNIAYKNLRELKFSNEITAYSTQLVGYCNEQLPFDKRDMKLLMGKLNIQQIKRLLFIFKHKALRMGIDSNEFVKVINAQNILNEIIENNECYCLKQIAINGDDLIAIGFEQGREIGNVLNMILEMVVSEQIENDRQILIDTAKAIRYNVLL